MKCEYCGAEQNEGKFCEVCGMMMTRVMVNASFGKNEAVEQKKLACRYCGHEQAGGIFCDQCGMRLDVYRPAPPEPAAVKCPECGAVTTRQVCPNCGTRVYRPEEA
jgi:hypothetical protein